MRAGNGQVKITYDAPNAAPVAADDSYTTAEDVTLTVPAPGDGSLTLAADGVA